MAEGAWVPVYDSLWESQKTTRLARELKVPIENAGVKFLKLCAWARDHVESGELGRVADRSLLAKATGLAAGRGDELYRALQVAHFISDDERGYIVGWEDGPGKLVESRRIDRLRKAHDRGAHDSAQVGGCPKCARAAVGAATSQASATVRPGTGDGRASHVTGTSQARATNSSIGRPVPVSPQSTGQTPTLSTDRTASPDLSIGRPPDAVTLSTRRETTETREKDKNVPPSPQDTPAKPDGEDQAARLAWVLASAGEEHRWRDVITELAKTHPLANIETWFTTTRVETFGGGGLVVVAPNAFASEWLASKYTRPIQDAMAALGMERVRLTVLTAPELERARAEAAARAATPAEEPEIPDAPSVDADQPYARVRGDA